MLNEVKTASAAGIIEQNGEGTGFYIAPARPQSGGRYYPGSFPARVRIDNGAPLDVPGPAVYRPRPFKRLRIEGVQPGSHWQVVILEADERFERASATRATFNVLEGLGFVAPVGGGGSYAQMPAAAPALPTDGYLVQPNWTGLQFVFNWGVAAPRQVRIYWHDGVRWTLSEVIGAGDAPVANGCTIAFRQVLHPAGRIYLADPDVGATPAYFDIHATADVG